MDQHKKQYRGIRYLGRSLALLGTTLVLILAILLGSMGIHNFYLGYTRKGVTHLMMFVFFLGWASQLWAIDEALMILTGKVATDANGWPLTD